jgi:PucR family transcriptional regulator, purine catabolism regulatory protein
VLGAVARSLHATVALCTARGAVAVSGELRTAPAQIAAVRSPGVTLTAGLNVAVQPMAQAGRTPPLWLVAERADGGPLWREQAPRTLALAHGWVSASVAGERLHLEHQARLHAELLWELQEISGEAPGDLLERAERAAWPLTGWHTGIHVRSVTTDAIEATTLNELDERLAAAGISVPRLIPRADGASTWLTAASRAGAPAACDLISRLRDIFGTFGSGGFVAGVGSPESGPAGIGLTLADARTAALLAQADEAGGRVRSSATLGPARLLLEWRTSVSGRQDARQILRPLLDADPVLLSTLASYLDSAGVTTMTARRLGVHRNTVRQRIARIEALLDADLSDPDTRLALQLAQRLV